MCVIYNVRRARKVEPLFLCGHSTFLARICIIDLKRIWYMRCWSPSSPPFHTPHKHPA